MVRALLPAQLVMLVSLAAFAPPLPAQEAGANLVVNGDFERDADGDGWADGWQKRKGADIRREKGSAWLVLDGSSAATRQDVKLKPEWWKLKLTMRMRITGVEVGDQSWKDARLAMSFHDAKGKRVGPWPSVFHGTGTTDWVAHSREYAISRGAAGLALNPANFGTTGKVEFDDIRIVVTRNRALKKADRSLPPGVTDVWSMSKAWRRASRTRERICINGLWAFRPVMSGDGTGVPRVGDCWGWFRVPGIWPGSHWSLGAAAQKVLLAPWLEESEDRPKLDRAWYKREIAVPKHWAGRRVLIDFTMVQSHARVLIDGKDAGEVWFPGGRLDVTGHARPGRKQTLAVFLTARPIEMEENVFMAPDRIIKRRAGMRTKGLTGDVFLVGEPQRDAIADVHVITSTRQSTITFDTGLRHSSAGGYRLSARVLAEGKTVRTFGPEPATPENGRVSLTGRWPNPKLWDTDTPSNMYEAIVTLHSANGRVLDESLPIRFGFREFWIDGRDFYLNGRPIHLRALNVRNIGEHADKACIDGCRNTCRKMIEYGFNFFITSNYNFLAGAVGYMDALFEAADETGVLASFSLPHCKDFKWKLDTPEQRGRYRALAEWLIRRVQNHPSVVAYAMNHNATGYYGDQNPLKIDGIYDPTKVEGVSRHRVQRRAQAELAAEIAKAIDPTRPAYHHQSGNLGDMHTVNIYLNWAPRQERSDWLEHWATVGVKPLFFVEWGLPHISSWSSYRGPKFIWRYEAFQQTWDSEFAAAYIGQRAYRMTESKIEAMALEERLWARGKPFRWSTLCQGIRPYEENHREIKSLFADDNWRSHRTWGISSMLPWDQGDFWTRVNPTPPRDVHGKYVNLQQPGIVPDTYGEGSQYIYDMGDDTFKPSSVGRSFLRWNMPLLAYIGGGPKRFTDKGHNFTPGETARKQLVIVNDTRRERTCSYEWRWSSKRGRGNVTVQPGGKTFVPAAIPIPNDAPSGRCTLSAVFKFDNGDVQKDSIDLHVVPKARRAGVSSRIALYDPKGMTAKLLDGLGVKYARAEANASLRAFDILVIGREALSNGIGLPGIARMREGLKVLVFEQTADVLANRLGFRVNVHGMRAAFARAASHPALTEAGLRDDHLHDWRGAATLVPPYLALPALETRNPTWTWCDFENTRVWRCGNHGNVASVLIEKPPKGNWLPVVDCGFDLQYAPLLECVEGRGRIEGCGRIVFCQLDVTGRTQPDPAARKLCAGLLRYLDSVRPATGRPVLYAGDKRCADLLRQLGVPFDPLADRRPDGGRLLVVGPGTGSIPNMTAALEDGLNLLCLGLSRDDLQKLLPGKVRAKDRSAVSTTIERLGLPEYAGISNAELHWRTRPKLAALAQTSPQSNEALEVVSAGKGRIVLCQAAPWMFDYAAKPYLRTTHRRNMFLVSRLLANLGASFDASVAERIAHPPVVRDFPLDKGWVGQVDRDDVGRARGWWRPAFGDSGWRPIDVPGQFDRQRKNLKGFDGLFWYRKRFSTPANIGTSPLTLHIGPVDDESWVWLNGKLLGEVTKKTHPKDYWSFPREYEMDPRTLRRDGENVLVVRVNDTYQTGGINGTPRFHRPGLWLSSYYVQHPQAVDDPYRYYRW